MFQLACVSAHMYVLWYVCVQWLLKFHIDHHPVISETRKNGVGEILQQQQQQQRNGQNHA